MFWMFFLRLIAEKGESHITWKYPQEDSTFVKMGKVVGKTRNQCRSFNQRMKNVHFRDGIADIPEIV